MGILKLFSKRQREQRGEIPDVYRYDKLPMPLRVQIVHIITDALGTAHNRHSETFYQQIHDALAREFGVFRLTNDRDPYSQFLNFFLKCDNIEQALDCVELSFRVIDDALTDEYLCQLLAPKIRAADAIGELNVRFKEHGIGFQFESGEIVRTDSAVLHEQAVKPTLSLLRRKEYAGAEKEFLRAHEHYRHGRHEEAISDALKSMESVLKTICAKRKWAHAETDTAKKLLDVVFSNGLVPAYLQSEFGALRTTLESGVPTVRNKESGHGTGVRPRKLPGYLASYVLHMAASSILLLVQAEAELK